MNLLENLPSDETLDSWILILSEGELDATREEVKYALIADIGYRAAMFKFSPFISKELKDDVWKHALQHYKHPLYNNGEWQKGLDSDERDSLFDIINWFRTGE